MIIGVFVPFCKDNSGNKQSGGAMDFIDNFLETLIRNTALKKLIKTPSLTIFLPVSYLKDCFIYVFSNHGKDQFKNKIGEIL